MSKQQLNNIQFVTELMNYSKSGALIQAFVIAALEKYSQQVLADTSVWPANSLINQEAWGRCAQEVIDKIEARSAL
jgi:hypothetical protein